VISSAVPGSATILNPRFPRSRNVIPLPSQAAARCEVHQRSAQSLDVVVRRFWDELVLDLDCGKTSRLTHADGAVHAHRVAEATRGVEDQW
jgi:hypothetical protein